MTTTKKKARKVRRKKPVKKELTPEQQARREQSRKDDRHSDHHFTEIERLAESLIDAPGYNGDLATPYQVMAGCLAAAEHGLSELADRSQEGELGRLPARVLKAMWSVLDLSREGLSEEVK
jgi:hypothetical protein